MSVDRDFFFLLSRHFSLPPRYGYLFRVVPRCTEYYLRPESSHCISLHHHFRSTPACFIYFRLLKWSSFCFRAAGHEEFKGRLAPGLRTASAGTQQFALWKATAALRCCSYLHSLFKKITFSTCWWQKRMQASFAGLCWVVAAGDFLFSSPTTHSPPCKTGGKNAIVLKIKLDCVATYCKTLFLIEGKKKNFCGQNNTGIQTKTEQTWKISVSH